MMNAHANRAHAKVVTLMNCDVVRAFIVAASSMASRVGNRDTHPAATATMMATTAAHGGALANTTCESACGAM